MNGTLNINDYINEMNEYKQGKKIRQAFKLFTSIFKDVDNQDIECINMINNQASVIDYLQYLGVYILNGLGNSTSDNDILNKLEDISIQVSKLSRQVRKDIDQAKYELNTSINNAVTNIENNNSNIIENASSKLKVYTNEELVALKDQGMSWLEISKITGINKNTVRSRVYRYKEDSNNG